MATTHGVSSTTPLTGEDAEQIARLMSALATASRVRILAHLRQRACPVSALAGAVEMAQPAVSHQLRILRDLGLVVGRREGRNTVYALHDSHVARLLDEALRHIQHTRVGSGVTATGPGQLTWPMNSEEIQMTDEHAHPSPHAHSHSHNGTSHSHAHGAHAHEHIEHAHEHSHGGDAHTHPHAHQADLPAEHEHAHA